MDILAFVSVLLSIVTVICYSFAQYTDTQIPSVYYYISVYCLILSPTNIIAYLLGNGFQYIPIAVLVCLPITLFFQNPYTKLIFR